MSGETYDRFTKRTKYVLGYAQREARAFKQPAIGSEHLLLGLILDSDGVAGYVLQQMSVDYRQARDLIELFVGLGADTSTAAAMSLGPSAEQVIAAAVAEAHHLNHHYVGTEQLLLGLITSTSSVPKRRLRSLVSPGTQKP